MDHVIASRPARSGFIGMLLLGLLLVVMGIPFVGMALMTIFLLSDSRSNGIPGALLVMAGVYLLTDFMGALIAATGAGFLSVSLRSGQDLASSVSITAGTTAVLSVMGMLIFPEMSLLAPRSVEAIIQVYSATGLKAGEINTVFRVFLFIVPSLMALWAAGGTMAAAGVAAVVSARRGRPLRRSSGGLRLGLVPAWLLIISLSVNLAGHGLPHWARQGAMNVSIFLTLPYMLVGFQVARAALRVIPGIILPVLIFAIFLPPVAMGVLVLVGIMDTWLDFRLRLAKHVERKAQK